MSEPMSESDWRMKPRRGKYRFCALCGDVHTVTDECGTNRPKTPKEIGEAKLRAWDSKHILCGKEPVLTEEEMKATEPEWVKKYHARKQAKS